MGVQKASIRFIRKDDTMYKIKYISQLPQSIESEITVKPKFLTQTLTLLMDNDYIIISVRLYPKLEENEYERK